MSKQYYQKEFYEFLVNNGALFAYTSQLTTAWNMSHYYVDITDRTLQGVIDNIHPEWYIDVLHWHYTTEKSEYWKKLDEKWRTFLYEKQSI